MSILCLCRTGAVRCAAQTLSELGLPITEKPSADTAHLLLPVPSCAVFDEIKDLLPQLPPHLIISGGNLNAGFLKNYRTVDFLQDPYYLAENAAITAHCALELVKSNLSRELDGCPVLILGWGRIGKCLGKLLKSRGADVSIAARKEADLAMLHALGYHAVPISHAKDEAAHYQVILNTVPAMVLPELNTRTDCVAVELASAPGMTGGKIISARGLPGKMAPTASGKLIAETFIRLSLNQEV